MNFEAGDQPVSDERLLLNELTHRFNNEFAAAIGIVSVAMATSTAEEVRAELATVLDRLQNLGRLHQSLRIPDHETRVDVCAYLRPLCEAIVRSQLEYRGIRLTLVEHSFLLSSMRCWMLGMILTELVFNSVRHAFQAKPEGGEIHVEVQPRGRLVECRIQDNGMGAATVKAGYGLKIVEALARRLDGAINHQFSAQGCVATLTFPLTPAA
jgi:two-component sensor histidine kinase